MRAWRLSWLRFWRRSTGLGGAVLLIAAVQGVLVLVISAQATVESQAVAERVSALPPASQWLSVTTSDPQALPDTIRALAIPALQGLSGKRIFEHLTYRPLSDQRFGRYQLLAAAGPAAELTLDAGRLPSACTPSSCEVLLVGRADFHAPSGLQVVGHARLRPDAALALGLEPGTPLLVGADVSGMARLRALVAVPHTLSWSARIDPSIINATGIGGYIDRLMTAADRLSLQSGQLQLVAPTTQLAATHAQVLALQRRMLGLALCLLLIVVFSVHRIALASRREHDSLLQLGRQYDWSTGESLLLTGGLAALVVGLGGLIGVGIGVASSELAFRSPHTVEPLLAWWTVTLLGTGWLALIAGLALRRWAGAAVLALACGTWVTIAWLGGYDGQVLLLSCAGGALAVLLAPAGRRFATRPFTRNLLRANASRFTAMAVVTGFLAAFVMSSMASLATLQQGITDHAIFASPLATRITWGDRLPMQDHSLSDYSRMSGGGRVFPVRTVVTSVRESVVQDIPVQLISVDPGAWTQVPDISDQTGVPNRAITSALPANANAVGQTLRGKHRLSGHVLGLASTVSLSVWVMNDRLESTQIPLTVQANGRFNLQISASTVALLGFALAELPDAMAHRAHAVGEGRNALAAPTGTLVIDALSADTAPLDIAASLPATGPMRAMGVGSLRWPYALVGGQAFASVVRPPVQVRAVVDPATSSLVRNGVIAVRLNGAVVVPVRVSLVVQRLPTVSQRFILLDPGTLDGLLAAYAPESLRVSDIWLTRPLAPSVAQSEAMVGLTVTNRAGVEALDAASSSSAWSERTLELLVLVVVLLFIAFALTSVREVVGTSDFAGWEAQGLPRSRMSRTVRDVVVALTASAAALALAVLLLLLPVVLTWSNIDLSGNPAVPPLAPQADLGRQLLVLVGTLLLAWTAATAAARSGVHRAPAPEQP